MSLKERIYSILVVSASDTFNAALSALLSESSYAPVHIVHNIAAAKRHVTEKSYDFVLINSPLPDDIGTRFAIDLSSSKGTVVLFFAKSDIHAAIHDKVAEYGVFTIPKPISRQILLQALGWMSSARERLRQSEKKSSSIEEKMAEIRLVNRAKWLLISELQMTEPEAHRYIEKRAMDECATKRSIAENIINLYS